MRFQYDFPQCFDDVLKGYLNKYNLGSKFEVTTITDWEQKSEDEVCLTRRLQSVGDT